jgi:hypothetical protein
MTPTDVFAAQQPTMDARPRVVTREEIAQDLSDLLVVNLRCQSKILMADDVEERERLSVLIQLSKTRMQIAVEALDGNLEPYLWMRGEMRSDASTKTAVSEAKDPNRLDFETIRDVVGMARQMAMDSFHRQALSLAEAEDAPSREVGIGLLVDAEKQARTADAAYKALIAAEEANRACLITLCRHNTGTAARLVEAESHAAASRSQLRAVAAELDSFSNGARSSANMQTSILRAVAADRMGAGRDLWVQATQGFANNLRGFAERVRRFGDAIVKTPALVHELASASALSMEKVATHAMKVAHGGFERSKERLWSVLEKAGARILEVEHKIVATVEAASDEIAIHGEMAKHAIGRLQEVAFRTASRAAGLGPRMVDVSAALIQSATQATTAAYQDSREQSKNRLLTRRAP